MTRAKLFRCRIKGDSMDPVYRDGAIVEFRSVDRKTPPGHRHAKHPVEVGKDYFFQRLDGQAMFRRVFHVDHQGILVGPIKGNVNRDPSQMPAGPLHRIQRSIIARVCVAVGEYIPFFYDAMDAMAAGVSPSLQRKRKSGSPTSPSTPSLGSTGLKAVRSAAA